VRRKLDTGPLTCKQTLAAARMGDTPSEACPLRWGDRAVCGDKSHARFLERRGAAMLPSYSTFADDNVRAWVRTRIRADGAPQTSVHVHAMSWWRQVTSALTGRTRRRDVHVTSCPE
jgi:hypothetical protein